MRDYFEHIRRVRCYVHGKTFATYREWLEHLRVWHDRNWSAASTEARDGE